MIIGIDIGTAGALALLSPDGELVEVADMPCLRDGPKGRPNVNGPLLAELVYRRQAKQAFVEMVNARPGEGAVAHFPLAGHVAWWKAFLPPAAFRLATSHRLPGSAL
jgi:hypothetical protein